MLETAHLEAQPLMHTRLVSNQEVNENLKAWASAMLAEFKSLCEKGAIQEFSDQHRKKYRAVICGNYQKYSDCREAESLYAGGAVRRLP